MGHLRLLWLNLFFIFIFLNIWDFVVSGEFINAMLIGIIVFGLPALLWFVGTIRATVALTVLSIFEFMVLAVFLIEGFNLSGSGVSLKTLFLLPYLVMTGINGYWGLSIYSVYKDSSLRSSQLEIVPGLKDKSLRSSKLKIASGLKQKRLERTKLVGNEI